MHAACVEPGCGGDNAVGGEAGTGRWHGGDTRSLGQLATRSQGPLRQTLRRPRDRNSLAVSELRHQTLVPTLHPGGSCNLEAESPGTPTQPHGRTVPAVSPSPEQTEGCWTYRHLPRGGCAPLQPRVPPQGPALRARPAGAVPAAQRSTPSSSGPGDSPRPRHVCPRSPSFSSQPSRSGLKKVWVRSLPSSSGILKGSFLMLS